MVDTYIGWTDAAFRGDGRTCERAWRSRRSGDMPTTPLRTTMPSLNYDMTADPGAQEQVAAARARLLVHPLARERAVELMMSCGFVVAAVAIAVLAPGSQALHLGALVVLVLACALVSRVEFEVGTGFTTPTVLVVFPLLFVFPARLVPLAMAAAYLLGFGYLAARGRRHIGRVVNVPAQAWHAVGPALLVALADPGTPGWEDWPLALAALLAYLACDAAASLGVDRFALRVPVRSQLAPAAWVYLVDVLLAPMGFALAIAAHNVPLGTLVVLPLCGVLAIFALERRRRLDHALELSRAYRGTALLLGDVVEADHDYTGAHSRDVVELALRVGRRLGLDARSLRNLEFGALLHDVGKITIPKEIIDKPGKLNDAEWAIMKTHTLEGQRMLDSVGGVLGEVGVIVRGSHEDYDGTGYPDGLAGDAIPIESRICSACDAFSAMTTDRSYRKAMPLSAAITELRRCAGTQFDPRVIDALVEIIGAAEPEPLPAGVGG
jgi:HD-GYP domain-containing protein (c-di-GMP phosphodiesterase class II)